jgi:hypothetical protein
LPLWILNAGDELPVKEVVLHMEVIAEAMKMSTMRIMMTTMTKMKMTIAMLATGTMTIMMTKATGEMKTTTRTQGMMMKTSTMRMTTMNMTAGEVIGEAVVAQAAGVRVQGEDLLAWILNNSAA